MQKAWNLSLKEQAVLRSRGWVSLFGHAESSHDFKLSLLRLGQSIGKPTRTRTRELVDELTPQAKCEANASSLSRITGTSQQPWHMDLAHKLEPARYLVMGMHECSPITACTELLDTSLLIREQDRGAAFSEPFLVRTGASSFYATIVTRSQPFMRFDPGCMFGATYHAKQLMQKILDQDLTATYAHLWESGSVLIIDNWKMLHRRTDASCSTERILYRVSVMGETE